MRFVIEEDSAKLDLRRISAYFHCCAAGRSGLMTGFLPFAAEIQFGFSSRIDTRQSLCGAARLGTGSRFRNSGSPQPAMKGSFSPATAKMGLRRVQESCG